MSEISQGGCELYMMKVSDLQPESEKNKRYWYTRVAALCPLQNVGWRNYTSDVAGFSTLRFHLDAEPKWNIAKSSQPRVHVVEHVKAGFWLDILTTWTLAWPGAHETIV